MPGTSRPRQELLLRGGSATPDPAAGAIVCFSNRLVSSLQGLWMASSFKGTLMGRAQCRAGAELSPAMRGLY